jgi:hypothetical protein
MSISALPLALGTMSAVRHLRTNKAGPYLRNLWGSTAAGLVAIGLLFGSLFRTDLSSSSTAGLIFLFAPIYSGIALGIGYGLGALTYRTLAQTAESSRTQPAISSVSRRFIWVPVTILSILMFGVIKYSIQNNDLEVAERAASPETLQWVYEKAVRGEADPFGVPLFLAQNPNTPPSILEGLSKHEHSSVRVFVVRHPNTSFGVITSMSNDCDQHVRKEVQERLKLLPQSGSAPQPAPQCGETER